MIGLYTRLSLYGATLYKVDKEQIHNPAQVSLRQ